MTGQLTRCSPPSPTGILPSCKHAAHKFTDDVEASRRIAERQQQIARIEIFDVLRASVQIRAVLLQSDGHLANARRAEAGARTEA